MGNPVSEGSQCKKQSNWTEELRKGTVETTRARVLDTNWLIDELTATKEMNRFNNVTHEDHSPHVRCSAAKTDLSQSRPSHKWTDC